VVDHLGGKASLEIEDQGTSQRSRNRQPDERPFVQMPVDDVWLINSRLPKRRGRQEGVKVKLVPRRTNANFASARQAERSNSVEARDVSAGWIGANPNVRSQAFERQRFLENSDVAAVVGEKGRRGELEHAVRTRRDRICRSRVYCHGSTGPVERGMIRHAFQPV
jgi:hypothetical protein